jgi:hypothetical protein
MTGKPQLPRPPDKVKPHLRRNRIVQAALFMLLVAVPLGVYMYQHRPNVYDSARTDLLEASRELDIYQKDMELLVQKDREGAEALKASIHWLQKAAASDPEDLAEIGAITDGLQRWEVLAHQGDLSSADLHQQYGKLDTRVQRLIKKRGKASQDN